MGMVESARERDLSRCARPLGRGPLLPLIPLALLLVFGLCARFFPRRRVVIPEPAPEPVSWALTGYDSPGDFGVDGARAGVEAVVAAARERRPRACARVRGTKS